jgi:hypothetical protein
MPRSLSPVLALLAACGGPNPLEGDWTCPTGSDDWTNEMFVDEQLTGDLLMHYTQGGTSYHSVFEHQTDDRGRGLYWIDVVCVEDCPESGKDFRMTCELSEDEQSLDCEADGWYELPWERVD